MADEFDSLSSAAVPGVDNGPADGQAPADVEALRADAAKAKAQAQEQRDLYLPTTTPSAVSVFKLSEAVGTRESADVPANTVVDEARKGYMIGDELLRPAQVIVSKSSE